MSSVLGQERKSLPKATVSLTIVDLAWAAGFLEGEGSFTKSGRDSETVNAAQIKEGAEPLYKLQQLFGGSVRIKDRCTNRFGRKTQLRWTVCGGRARGVMLTLFSFLSPRRKQQIINALHAKSRREQNGLH